MYQINDCIMYGTAGVCRVSGYRQMDASGTGESKLYYMLKPLYQDGVIYTPAENGKVWMRPILSPEEALALIDRIPQIETEVCQEKSAQQLAEHYEARLRLQDCDAWAALAKSLYRKKREREQQKRRFGQVDEKFWKRTEDLLFGEIAAALSMDRDEVPQFIEERIQGQM